MPKNITLAKTEYNRLRKIAEKYEMLRKIFELDFFAPPPSANTKKIIGEFRATGLYNEAFLKSLSRGLKESSYFTQKPLRY